MNKDVLMLIALELDIPTLFNYCKSNSRMNEAVCNNDYFWVRRLKQDFNIDYTGNTPKSEYENIYRVMDDIAIDSYKSVPNIFQNLTNKKKIRDKIIQEFNYLGQYYYTKISKAKFDEIVEKIEYSLYNFLNRIQQYTFILHYAFKIKITIE